MKWLPRDGHLDARISDLVLCVVSPHKDAYRLRIWLHRSEQPCHLSGGHKSVLDAQQVAYDMLRSIIGRIANEL